MAQSYEVESEVKILIHNDLFGCAAYFSDIVKNKSKTDETHGISLDIMAALIFSAFEIEAKINFVGSKIFMDDWPERKNMKCKIQILFENLGMGFDWGRRPLQTLRELQLFRDTLAHGKPQSLDETGISRKKPDVMDALKADWQRKLTLEFLMLCREDINVLWNLLLEHAKIPDWETTTGGILTVSTVSDPD